MLAQPGCSHEGLDVCKDVAHEPSIARYSVQVNARDNVSALHAHACQNQTMTDGWFERLKIVIENDDRSLSKLSLEAGLGRNFVQQMLRDSKEPGTEKLKKILSTFPEATAIFVLVGIEIDESDLAFLRALKKLPPDLRRDAAQLVLNAANLEGTS